MIQPKIGQTARADKPSLVPVRFLPPKLPGYAPHLLFTVRVSHSKKWLRAYATL